TNNLYSINRSTGSATLIGSFGVPLMHALAFDNSTGTLYGAYGGNNGLYKINPSTGAATLIGITGFTVCGLAFDPPTNTLYGTSYAPGDTRLLRINTTTGQATQIATIALTGISDQRELAQNKPLQPTGPASGLSWYLHPTRRLSCVACLHPKHPSP